MSDTATPLHTISYGGGVQSTALLAYAARGVIPHRTFLFANTGDDSEAPESLAYVREIAMPFAAAHGLEVIEVQRTMRDGTPETILGRIERTAKSEVIPVRSSKEGPPLSRSCTMDFKIRTLGKWLKDHGATEDNPAHIGIGISLDEIHRANRKPNPYEHITYPLLGTFPGDPECCRTTLKVRRSDCPRVIADMELPAEVAEQIRDAADAGRLFPTAVMQLEASGYTRLPVPPKSSCWFCPHHSLNAWIELRNADPERFERAAQIEERITAKAGKPRFLTRYGRPLREVIPEDAAMLPFADMDDADCATGVCFT